MVMEFTFALEFTFSSQHYLLAPELYLQIYSTQAVGL
jgi:hypothetical protein